MTTKRKCPIQGCNFEFSSGHYTDREPHLRENHTTKELAREIQYLLGRKEWADRMANEIIDACETLRIADSND